MRSKPTVLIKTIYQDEEDYREKDEFYINGEKIDVGYYGGEPEDNSKGRDYDWVAKVIEKIATRLGAEVTYEQVRDAGENFYSD